MKAQWENVGKNKPMYIHSTNIYWTYRDYDTMEISIVWGNVEEYLKKGAQESPWLAQRMWWKSSANGSFQSAPLPLRQLVKVSFLWEACIHFLGGYWFLICQFFPFPSVSCICPAPPHLKFWDIKDIIGLDSVVGLLPWFLPSIMPILFVGSSFLLTFLWQLYFTRN